MDAVLSGLRLFFLGIPHPLLEAWGLAAYVVGWGLLVLAFGNLTLRIDGRWTLGWRQQAWDDKAMKAILITFVAILVSGFLGSYVVLVPGAQTLESLKDLAVFLCLVVFGYPALLIVPFAYGLSDLVEGVPFDFLLAWLPGYWINPACFWLGVLLLGKDPNWRSPRVWLRYGGFVAAFLLVEPLLWGWISADTFPGLSYHEVTPALVFTTALTWLLAPGALVLVVPWARRRGWLWSARPDAVREYDVLRSRWQPGHEARGLPIRLALALPVLALLLVTAGITAVVAVSSGTSTAAELADQLHAEQARSLALELDALRAQAGGRPLTSEEVGKVLSHSPAAARGRVYLFDNPGTNLLGAAPRLDPDPILEAYQGGAGHPLDQALSFDVVQAQPMSHTSWMARATAYHRPGAQWTLVIAMPSTLYLGGLQSGASQAALVIMWSLGLTLLLVVLFTSLLTRPLDRIVAIVQSMAKGTWSGGVPEGRIAELNLLTEAFNAMEKQIRASIETIRANETDFRNIFDRSLEGLYRTSLDGRVLRANPALASLLGYESVEHLLRSVRDTGLQVWARPEDRAQVVSRVQAEGQIPHMEAELVRADGSLLWADVSVRLVEPEGQTPYLEGFILDITDRKNAALELQRHQEQLEAMVADRTRELVAARDSADRANQAKTTFLSNMSHEIRSPMNAVLGFAQLLTHDPTLSQASRNKVATILRSGGHLMAIIDEILEMARVESGHVDLRLQSFDPIPLLAELADQFQPRAAEKGLSLLIHADDRLPTVVGDLGKVRQIVTNLVSNALKYTLKGSVTVRAWYREDRLGIEVIDTGIGLASEEQSSVFEPFERAAAGEVTAGGTGLGLAISQRYAGLMGGAIRVESTPGQGSRFWVELPLEVSKSPAPSLLNLPRMPILEPGHEGTRVLVVDDIDLNRELLRALLEPLGLIVEEAGTGQEALVRAQARPPQLVLLDLRMPGWNGFETTRRMRELPFGPELIIIGVSASAFDHDRQKFLDSGIDGFLAKPYLEGDLYAVLETVGGLHFVKDDVRAADYRPSLEGIPLPWIEALHQALEQGSLSAVRALIPRLPSTAEPLALWLADKLTRYDLEAVRAFLTGD